AVCLLWRTVPFPTRPVEGRPELAFDGERALATVTELVQKYPNRVAGSAIGAECAHDVAERMRRLGLDVSEEPVPGFGHVGAGPRGQQGMFWPVEGVNVIGISPGQTGDVIVVGAHRDVVRSTEQGANDNASGSGAMLELARILTSRPHQHTLVFVSFDAEEIY